MSTLPPGVTLRRPRWDDRDALLALCRADEIAATGRSSVTSAEIDELLHPAHTSIEEDQWVATAGDRVVGYVLVWDHGRTDHQDVDVYADPDLAAGDLAPALLDLAVVRLAERARQAGYTKVVTSAGCHADDEQYAATLRSRGFRYARTFNDLRIDLPSDEPVEQSSLVDVEVTGFTGTDEDWRQLHVVMNRGFADHWGFAPTTCADFRADAEAEPHGDRPQWRVAVADERLVGAARASGRNAEVRGGWIAELAVLPEYRGRGVARALLRASFEAYRQVGRDWVGLAVDSANGTGAVRLYESVGMRLERQIYAYERDVLPTG
jgi:mycothiol synthase